MSKSATPLLSENTLLLDQNFSQNVGVSLWQKLKSKLSLAKSATLSLRAVRIRIFSGHQTTFELFSTTKKKFLEISNLSTTGMGLKRDTDTSWQALGQKLTGQLNLRGKPFRVTVEVRHITQGTVGCKFISTEPNLDQSIEEHLIYEITGIGLKKIDPTYLRSEEDGRPQWFVDSQGNELYLVEKNGYVLRFHVALMGNYIEWKTGSNLKFGIILEEKNQDAKKQKSSHVVRYSDNIPREIKRVIARLLENVEGLPSDYKTQILNAIRI